MKNYHIYLLMILATGSTIVTATGPIKECTDEIPISILKTERNDNELTENTNNPLPNISRSFASQEMTNVEVESSKHVSDFVSSSFNTSKLETSDDDDLPYLIELNQLIQQQLVRILYNDASLTKSERLQLVLIHLSDISLTKISKPTKLLSSDVQTTKVLSSNTSNNNLNNPVNNNESLNNNNKTVEPQDPVESILEQLDNLAHCLHNRTLNKFVLNGSYSIENIATYNFIAEHNKIMNMIELLRKNTLFVPLTMLDNVQILNKKNSTSESEKIIYPTITRADMWKVISYAESENDKKHQYSNLDNLVGTKLFSSAARIELFKKELDRKSILTKHVDGELLYNSQIPYLNNLLKKMSILQSQLEEFYPTSTIKKEKD